jgi:pantetheine-phosphate adenylyltransferase
MRIAVYAGTFDPITLGHLSVIRRAARMFDRLIVLIAVNPSKKPLFTLEERLLMNGDAVRESNVECASTEGYVVQFAQAHAARYLVRGVRTATDIEDEIALATMNYQLAPDVGTVFIPAEPGLSQVSSSRLKELAGQGADITPFCTLAVERRLRARLGSAQQSEASHV